MIALTLSPDTLVIFLDETGDENTSDPNHPIFGFGGCAVLAPLLDTNIRTPWQKVRQSIAGDDTAPLHASKLPTGITKQQISSIGDFFRDNEFARIGVSCSDSTVSPDNIEKVNYVLQCLKQRIVDIFKYSPAQRLVIIFEESQRLGSQIEKFFGDLRIEENGCKIPIEFCFMPKSANDPALEVADFVAHAIGGHARQRRDSKSGFRKDFEAVFHNRDRRTVSYIHIEQVDLNAPS